MIIAVVTVIQILKGHHKWVETILVAAVHLVVFCVSVGAGASIKLREHVSDTEGLLCLLRHHVTAVLWLLQHLGDERRDVGLLPAAQT